MRGWKVLLDQTLERLIPVSERGGNVHTHATRSVGVVQAVPLVEPVDEMLNGCVDSSGLCRHPTHNGRVRSATRVSAWPVKAGAN